MPARNPDPAQGLITAGKGCQVCRSGSDIVIRPASRPLASCQSLVYSFPRDAMWRSWAASCLWLLFLIPVPLARHPMGRWLLFPPHRALLLPQKGARARPEDDCILPDLEEPLPPRGSAASNRCRDVRAEKGWPAVIGTCTTRIRAYRGAGSDSFEAVLRPGDLRPGRGRPQPP